MSIDVPIPSLGESVSEGQIVRWLVQDGAAVRRDEPLFELETDKASVEVPAPEAGVVHVLAKEGDTVRVGDVVARIDAGAAADGKSAPAPEAAKTPPPPAAEAPAAKASSAAESTPSLSPAVRRLVEENDLDPASIAASGRAGRLTKEDVLKHLAARAESSPSPDEATARPTAPPAPAPPPQAPREPTPYPPRAATETIAAADVERTPMTRLRQRIAERLLQAQRGAAILTTFNEIDMSAVLSLRSRHKESFAAAHGVSLGFMSFFARACIAAIRDVPIINAQIDGNDVVRNKHVNLGIAVGTERGLVVPILPRADLLSFAEIEKGIAHLAALARDNKLAIADLSGGTFTISNGGVYGSLLSTPILNPPQSAILGMHKIEKRPVAIDDQVVVRPMMYVALSYDHRLIDGAEAVTFLVRVKERLEAPERLLLEI